MAHFGTSVEYALHTLLNLGLLGDTQRVSSRRLAEIHVLPLSFVRKLLTRLERAGLIIASEGRGGGWALTRGLNSISYLEVVDAVSDDSRLFHCSEIRFRDRSAGSSCAMSEKPDLCAIHKAMLSAEAAMRERLATMMLGETARDVQARYGTDWLLDKGKQA